MLLMSATKQRSSAGKSVAIFFIVFIILEALIIFGVSRVFKNKDVTPSIAGYSMYIMDGDAMGDAVPKGSLVIASNGSPAGNDSTGKAVLCEEVPGVGTSVFWLAKIETTNDNGSVVYTVFQEKDRNKLYELSPKNMVGTATTYYETAGKIITFMTSKFGMIILIAAPLFLLVLLELIIMIVNRSRYSDYDDDDYEDDEDEDEEKGEEPVKLDDFLFGGKHDDELIKDRVRTGEEAAADITFNESVPVRKGKDRGADEDDHSESFAADPESVFDAPVRKAKNVEETVEEAVEQAAEAEPEQFEEEEPVKAAETVEAEEEAPHKADIHPSYYEKAAKLIDEGEDAAAKVEVTPVKPAAPEKKPEPAKAPDMKKVSAGFEDLMKLMEMETDKLKDQIDD